MSWWSICEEVDRVAQVSPGILPNRQPAMRMSVSSCRVLLLRFVEVLWIEWKRYNTGSLKDQIPPPNPPLYVRS